MSRADYFRSVLSEMGDRLGLGTIAFDGEDRACLTFNAMPITFAYRLDPVESVVLHVELGALPADNESAERYLLEQGLGAWASNVLTLGVGRDGKTAMGMAAVPLSGLDSQSLTNLLEQILTLALPVRDRLKRAEFAQDLASPADARPGAGAQIRV